MPSNRILACSSSKAGDSKYLQPVAELVKDFLGNAKMEIAFIPFASVGNSDEYLAKVKEGFDHLPYTITLVTDRNPAAIIKHADAIMVGGGNTFKLLYDLHELKLLDIIRDKVNNGTPYIGWSAGANVIGPGIGTTNDMPVIEPKSFNALGLLPFQINPHYTNYKPEGHNGESRDQRLEEFIQLNPGLSIVALPEGTALRLEGEQLIYLGALPGKLFYADNGVPASKEISSGQDISFLL